MTNRHPIAGLGALTAALLLCCAAAFTTPVNANTSHAGWPRIDGKLVVNRYDRDETIRGRPGAHNELLGGNGDDTIIGGDAGDVIWGDYKPSGQPTTQVDHIDAGNGKNFIYTSHGTNYVNPGGGSSIVHAHFGRGVITCQSANTVVIVTHHTQYKLHGCKHVQIN
jgi:RTX calcium-binding nonapeptide repeat (4 copies)